MKRGEASLRTFGMAAALLCAALILFRVAIYEGARSSAPALPAAEPPEAVVLSVTGEVQRAHDGAWANLAAGEKLGADAWVRTGKGARTDLRLGEKDRITVTESSDLIIKDLTREVHRLRLLHGRISVEQDGPDAPRVRIEDGAGEVVAEAKNARFAVLSTGTSIAVASERGQVTLTSAHATVSVSSGMESVAPRGQAPSAPRRVSTRVLLQVANALKAANAETCALLEGAVPQDAELTVDGVPSAPDATGRFDIKVPRERGKQSVVVALRDAAGRTRTKEIPCAPSPAQVRGVAIKWREDP